MFYCTALLLLAATVDVFGYNVKVSPDVGIIGGDPVAISRVPFMADLRYNDGTMDEAKHLCGGSILNERFILTAAHCCIEPNVTFTIAVGTENVHKGDIYEVEKAIPHEKYADEDTLEFDYDVCLVKSSMEITFSANVMKVELADKNFQLKTGMILNTTGWGFTEPFGNKSDILRQVSLPFVKQSKCEVIYEDFANITDRMICAGVVGKGVCHYDSGGPLMWKNKQVGITSFGKLCGQFPAVFAKITALLPWIKETITAHM